MTVFNGYTIYNRIKKLAHLRGMSLKEIAKKAGFKSPNAIYRYNQGVTPRETSIKQIAQVLQTTADYLKGKTDDWQKDIIKPEAYQVRNQDLDYMLDNAHAFDGQPMNEHDRAIIKGYLKGYFEGKKSN